MFEAPPQLLPHESLGIDDELELRALRPEDTEELFLLTDENREYLARYLPWVPDTTQAADCRIFIERIIGERKDGQGYGFGIIQRGRMIGYIRLMQVDQIPEIAYWVAESAAGQGVATKAAQTITEFGLNVLGLDTIMIRVRPDNTPSNRVAQKLGYKLTGIQTDRDRAHNIWVKKASYQASLS